MPTPSQENTNRFWTLDPTGIVTMVKDYTTPGNSYTWNTTGITPGLWSVTVWARSVGSSALFDAAAPWVPYQVNANIPPATGVTLNPPTPLGPQVAGTSVTWTGTATGGSGTYEYRFWLMNNTTGAVTMVQDYAVPGNSWTWVTTGLTPGTYSVAVWARSLGSVSPGEAFAPWTPYVIQ